jgi:GDPmannose 4,6-dehydratase
MDGYHLAEALVGAEHEVYGLVRGQRAPSVPTGVVAVFGDLLDQGSLCRAIEEAKPDAVANLAAATSIAMSWRQPALMSEVTGTGVLRLLEAVRLADPGIHVIQASSADMYGSGARLPWNETTPFAPRSPYGVAKLYAHQVVQAYREAYGMRASSMIMFNHSSPRQGPEFVVRKVCQAAARIADGRQDVLHLGSLEPRRDWGYAPDYMRAWMAAIGRDQPGDWVLATGRSRSLAELCRVAFEAAGLDWRPHVVTDRGLTRPLDVPDRVGRAKKAAAELGWRPEVPFEVMIDRMVRADRAAP